MGHAFAQIPQAMHFVDEVAAAQRELGTHVGINNPNSESVSGNCIVGTDTCALSALDTNNRALDCAFYSALVSNTFLGGYAEEGF